MAKTINTKAIYAAVKAALSAARNYAGAIETLKGELKGVERKDAQPYVVSAIAAIYGTETKDGLKGLTFVKDGTNFAAADQARTRIMQAVYGKRDQHKAAPAVQRFSTQRVEGIQSFLVGLSKAEARAYLQRALETLSFE